MLSSKLGADYEAIRQQAKIKTINVTLNDVSFNLKVRIPVKREMEAIQAAITDPSAELVAKLYEQFASPLRKTLEDAPEGFLDALNSADKKITVMDDDILIDGTSIKHVSQMTAIYQVQVEKYFALLVSATGEPISETYDEIAEEFPESVIREIVGKIDEVIKPNYKDAKKN